jgi:hypothetical protein
VIAGAFLVKEGGVNRAETDIEVHSLWGNYRGRGSIAVVQTAKTHKQGSKNKGGD